jgi:hypothetical protein
MRQPPPWGTVVFSSAYRATYLPQWVRSQGVASEIACPYRPRRTFGYPRCVPAGSCLIGTPCIQTIDPAQVCATVKEK